MTRRKYLITEKDMTKGKIVGTLGLSDCGKTVKIHYTNLGYDFSARIQMVIKAPRGTLVLYESNPCNDGVKGEAIKAFMEKYKNE